MKKKKKETLLEYLDRIGPQPELADAIERASKRMRKAKMRKFKI
jgi:predicted CopG family antitoxin